MAKILIASIGNAATRDGSYRYTNYQPTDRAEPFRTCYIIEAVKHFYQIDRLILFGTTGSDWQTLYQYMFATDENLLRDPAAELDENYEQVLGTLKGKSIEEAEPLLSALKDAMGSFCVETILLQYGLNDDELIANFRLLQRIAPHIQDGDELYFDITHAFRSLPMYALLVTNYIMDVLGIKVKLQMISYGMFEAESGKVTPIVNLRKLNLLMDYMKAAEEYRRYGTIYKLMEIQEETPTLNLTREEKSVFNQLSDTVSINNMKHFKSLVRKCSRISIRTADREVDELRLLTGNIFQDIAATFGGSIDDEIETQIRLAQWHYAKKRYIVSIITLMETMITFAVRLAGCNADDYSTRNNFRTKLICLNSAGYSIAGDMRNRYNRVRELRNKLAHAGQDFDKEKTIADINSLINDFLSVYTKLYKDPVLNKNQRDAFRNALNATQP